MKRHRRGAGPDYAPAGTGFLAANIRKQLGTGGNAFIMANHGVVVLGSDPERAVFAMGLLEKVSIAYLMALVTESGKIYTVPAPIREIAINKLRRSNDQNLWMVFGGVA